VTGALANTGVPSVEIAVVRGGRIALNHAWGKASDRIAVASLAQLGTPTAFAALRKPRLRGGFVNRNFRISFGDKQLVLITYAEPGEHGRWEQFMVLIE
jgi:hypothetical protein